MVLKDSKSCSTLSLRAVSTFWILVTLIASSSGFPQGNTSNSTTVDPNSNSSSTTITDEVSNSTIATTISPTNEATNTEPASEETTSSPINNDSTIAYLFNTEGSNETEASSTLSPENNSSHNTTLQEQSNQNEGSNPTTTATTTTTSPPVTETVTSHPSNDTPIATTINVLSTRVGETTVFEEGHTNQSKEVGTESTANSSSRSTLHTTEEVTTLSSIETNPPTTITSSSATTSVTTISSSSVPVPTTTTQELANSTEATPLATTLKSSSPSTTTQSKVTHEVHKTVPPTMVVSHPVTPTMEEEQIITTEKAPDLNNPVVGDGGKVSHSVKLDERIGDLQYQVYAIFASFGIISLIIILLIIALAMSISKLKEQVSSTRHVPYIPDNRTGDQIHAYDNSAFSSGHEMQERRRSHMDKEPSKQGYGVQNGNNTYERPETKSKNSRSKMENIPLESIRQKEAESSQKSKDVGGVDRDSKSTLMRYEDGVIPFQHEGEEPSPNGSMRRKPSS